MTKYQYDNLQREIGYAQSQLNNIQYQISQLTNQVGSFQNSNQSIQQQNSTLTNTLTSLQTQQTRVLDRLNILKSNQIKLQQGLNTAQNNSTLLNNQLNNLQSENTNLSGQNNSNQQVLNELNHLLSQFVPTVGVRLNATTLMTESLSGESLMSSSLVKESIKKKCVEEFDKILSQITNIDLQDPDGKTMLMHAAINGFFYGIEKLLNMGANVDLVDTNDSNALIYASALPHIRYVKPIIERTVSIDQTTKEHPNLAALHVLIQNSPKVIFFSEMNGELQDCDRKNIIGNVYGDESYMGTLYLAGPDSQDDGYTLNQEKTLRLFKYFADKGADINIQSGDGYTPFFIACMTGQKYLAHKLMENYQIDVALKDVKGYDSMLWALEFRDTSLLQKVLNRGANVNEQDNQGLSCLYWSTVYNWSDGAAWLINKGATHLPNKMGGYPIHQAVANQNLEMVQTLLGLGANVNQQELNAGKITPLFYAVSHRNLQMTKLLLDKGADVKIPNNQGYLPWHAAAEKDYVDVMQVLRPKMQDIDIKGANQFEMNALHVAANAGALSSVKYLVQQGSNIYSTCKITVFGGSNDYGYNALHIAALRNKLDVVKYLMEEKGVTLYSQTPASADPFYLSTIFGSKDLIEYLYSKGADINKRIVTGDVPIHEAVYNGRSKDILQFFKDKGANPKIKNYDGKVALHWLLETSKLSKEQKASYFKDFKDVFGVTKQDLQIADNSGLTIDQDLHNVFSQQEYEAIIIGNHLDQ